MSGPGRRESDPRVAAAAALLCVALLCAALLPAVIR